MNPAAWTTRLVDAPACDLLSPADVAKLFNFGEETLDRLVKAGEFPAPVRLSPGTVMYDWRAVAFWRLRCELFRGTTAAQKGVKQGATEG